MKLSPKKPGRFRDVGRRDYAVEIPIRENLQLFFPASLRLMIKRGYPIEFVECDEDEWSEVDFHPDLQQMRQQLKESLPH